MSELARILIVLGLVGANAVFVIAEYSIVTSRRATLVERAESGSTRAAAALRLIDDPVRLISTVQVAITALGVLAGAIGEPLVRDLLGGELPTAVSFLIAFGLVTYLMVVLGELVPKALSLERAESLSILAARPVEVVSWILYPVVWVLQGSARLVLRALGVRRVVAGRGIRSADELRAIVDEAERAGVIPQAQEEMLYNVFDFATREAADVMVPAHEVAWLDAATSPEEALNQVIGSAHTRLPVGEGSLDRPVGVIHAREVAVAASAGRPGTIEPLARPALLIPETKDVGALLRELRERREQLAVVVGEYGTTSGIVALEDILEEIVGEIEGEFELPDATIRHLDAATVLVSGSMTIDDFNEAIDVELPQDGPRTLAGLVFDALGRAPERGESITLAGVDLQVERMEDRRIARLKITAQPRRKH